MQEVWGEALSGGWDREADRGGRAQKTNENRVRLERIIVIAGILVVLFLTLVTSSYYQNVLNQVEKDGGRMETNTATIMS